MSTTHGGTTPMATTARLIRAYATEALAGYGEDETPTPLILAIRDAITHEEACHLGRALLARHHACADVPFRIGGDLCDPDLTAIATALGWEA